jgi:hypothetical protein
MKKADRKKLNDALDMALAPPRKIQRQALDALLDEYDQADETPIDKVAPDNAPTATEEVRGIAPSEKVMHNAPSSSPVTMTRQSSLPSLPSHSNQSPSNTPDAPKPTAAASVSPQRDFTKTANSIVREAVSSGLFKGKSKQLYDCLYSLTRGAIEPCLSVRISRPKLMKMAHIGSRITFETNTAHLMAVGLLEVKLISGEHQGNEYTVFLPEEITNLDEISQPSQTTMTRLTRYAQKLVSLVRLETSQSRHSLNLGDSTTYLPPNTLLKTESTDDDDTHTLRVIEGPWAPLIFELNKVVCALQGQVSNTPKEQEAWREVGRLLGEELKHAATLTDAISSVPAFLATHLRRKFSAGTKKEKPLTILDKEPRTQSQGKSSRPSQSTKITLATNSPAEHRAKKSNSVSSQYSFAECLRYAEFLQATGRGINNPGGLATTLHRTGLSDSLIAKFLEGETQRQENTGSEDSPKPFTNAEIEREIGNLRELIAEGNYTLEQIEENFGVYLLAEDWNKIRTAIEARAA